MSKITLSMSKETNEKLKALAKDDERSLSKYLERGLIYLANIPGGYHTIISTPTYAPTYIPHDIPGGITTPQPQPPFEPYANPEPYKITLQSNTTTPEGSAPAQPVPVQTPGTKATPSSADKLLKSIEEHEKELSAPSATVKFIRSDGEPFELEDFEKFLPEDTKNDDTYHTLKKHIPSLQLTTILREGATRSLNDFMKYLEEDYLYTLENALGYNINESMSPNTLRILASYLQPNVPDEYKH